MTKLLDKAELDKVKPGDLLKVVSYGKKGFGLEMVQSGKTMPVLLEMPKGLYRVMLARATFPSLPIWIQILQSVRGLL